MLYTHCRQFPHLKGLSDTDIRSRVRDALIERPRLIHVMRFRNRFGILAMGIAAYLLYEPQESNLGVTLMWIGGVGFVLTLVWNLVWVNRVLYRITQPPKQQDTA